LAFRGLLKNKLYSFLSITGFAFGFAVCIAIGLFAYYEYTMDNCHPNYTRIYRLVNSKKKTCKIDYNLNSVLANNNPEIEVAIPFDVILDLQATLKVGSRFTQLKSLCLADNNFFKVFPLKVILGNPDMPFAGRETAVITQSLASRLFEPSEDPIGKQLNLDNYFLPTISAVIEDFPSNSSFYGEILLNIDNKDYRFSFSCETEDNCINPVIHYILLDKGANAIDFAQKLNSNLDAYKFAIDSIELQPLQDIYLDNTVVDSYSLKGSRSTLIILITIGALIMLLSTINYLNYNLSLQFAKLREVGIKRVNGAGFRHLIGYYITEVSLGIIISIDFALIIVALFLPRVNNLLGKPLNLNLLLSTEMIAISLGSVILIILINSIAPLYILSRFSINTFFTGKKQDKGKMWGRNILTTIQFTIAVALLSCVFIIQKQLNYVQKADLGFNKSHLIKFSLPYNFSQRDALKHELEQLPFVTSTTFSHGSPGEINMWLGSADTTQKAFNLASITVDSSYLKTMELELIEGRWFLPGDVGKACIMNQEAIKQFGWKSFEGKQFNNGRQDGYQVIGVVKNFNFESHHKAISPACLLSCSPKGLENLYNYTIRITPGDVNSKIKQIETVWKRLSPEDPMKFDFYDTIFDNMYRKEKLLASIIIIFSIIAVALSGMGVLGQIFQTCINRTKEIGIRKVNGASTFKIVWMLNLNFVKLLAVAFCIATPLSYLIMDKWLQNFAYKTPLSWWVFVMSGLVVLTISAVAVTWQSWRAASRNPVEALRYE
jgi:putative ABC transport system permease protein